MERRTTVETLIFRHPFRLAGFEREEAAGVYTIEVEQEALDSLTVIGWRHLGTCIRLAHQGATELVPVDPAELREAQERDRDPEAKDFL